MHELKRNIHRKTVFVQQVEMLEKKNYYQGFCGGTLLWFDIQLLIWSSWVTISVDWLHTTPTSVLVRLSRCCMHRLFDSNVLMSPSRGPHIMVLRTQKLRTRLLKTQSSKILSLKPGAGQHITMYATFTARDFFLTNFNPCGPFTCIFIQNLLLVFFLC